MRVIIAGIAILLNLSSLQLALAEPSDITNSHAGKIHKSEYVDSKACAQCHKAEYKLWQGSHHQLAMQSASDETILGNFDDATFNYHGEISKFYKKGDKHYIETFGPNKKRHAYEVKYTFGVYPLQQYLIELPGGRLQAFTIAWDVQQKKWFHLHPDKKITVGDPLHWSKRFYNWNSNCAECHSTNIKKNYDHKAKTYHTTWSEVNVSCQSCHGPGKQHIQWANNNLADKKSKLPNNGLMAHPKKIMAQKKIEVCAACHSRRHPVSVEDHYGEPFFDHFMPALLRDDLYYPDGQIRDEVFEYGSFVQSKMFRAGVTCIDCHNPHSLKLKYTNNKVCTQCHNNNSQQRFKTLKQKDYDNPKHHHHWPGSTAAQCVTCHMPTKTYMQIDKRHDHSFRIPRPDLTEKLAVPNACNQCHTDKSAPWAAQALERWFGKKNYPTHFGEVFANARKGKSDAEVQLIKLIADSQQANIVRATATELLARFASQASENARTTALADRNVLVRVAAVRSLSLIAMNKRIKLLAPLLSDSVRAVRIETASALASAPVRLIPKQYRPAFQSAIAEYKSLQEANSDLPQSHLNLGNLFQAQAKHEQAIKAYESAISLDNSFYPAQQNLAMLLNSLGKNKDAEQVLTEAIKHSREQGELYYSLGLLYAEQGQMQQAIGALAKAASLLPDNSRVLYNYGLALQASGDLKTAEQVLLQAYRKKADDPDITYGLAIFYVRQRHWNKALPFARSLHQAFPESSEIEQLLKFIQSQTDQQKH